MASSYSTNLKIELQATGENSGTWGTITNTNLGTALEQAVVGYGNPSYASDANLTLTYTDTNAAQAARALVLNVTSAGSLTATRELIVPTIQKQYIVQNNTTGSQSITVKTSGGTGITVTNGRKAHLYVNGTDVIFMDDFVDINGGAIDGTTIGASSAAAGTFTTLGATTGNITTVNATTVDTTNVEVTNIKAKDGTAAGSIADSTGVVTLGSSVLTTTDINGGTIDGTVIGGAAAAAGTFTTATATTGNITTVNATTVDTTNIEVTNLKAKDGTAAGSIADSTGVVTLASSVLTTTDINGGTIDGTTIGGSSAAAGTFTTLTASSIATFAAGSAAAPSITTTGDTNTGIFFPAADTIAFTEGGVEAARFDSSGNFGIGCTPSSFANFTYLSINGTTGSILNLRSNNTTQFEINTTGTLNNFSSVTTLPFVWSINSAEHMRLDSSGNLGLGVTPSASTSNYRTFQIGATGSRYSIFGQRVAGASETFIGWNAYGGSNTTTSGSGFFYTTSGDTAAMYSIDGLHKWFIAPSGTANNAITFTQAMTLSAAGGLTVGGTTDPGAGKILAEGSSASHYVASSKAGVTSTYLITDANGANVQVDGSWPIRFTTNSTEKARITAAGDFVVGATAATSPSVTVYGSTKGVLWQNNDAATNGFEFVSYRRSNVQIGSVTQNGTTAVLFNTTSDARLKQNIMPAAEAGEKIDAIQIVSYDWKSAPDEHIEYGVIAQDLNIIAPQAVNIGDDGEEIKKTWGVDYSKLVPMLVKEIQSLRARVAQLESK